jgi:hypothetical protein
MSVGETIRVKDQPLQCKHCGRDRFVHRTAQLSTTFLTLFDLGLLSKSAEVYVCSNCGFLHWFLEPEVMQPLSAQEAAEGSPTDDELAEPTDCLECHATIPAGIDTCPACGWSYK